MHEKEIPSNRPIDNWQSCRLRKNYEKHVTNWHAILWMFWLWAVFQNHLGLSINTDLGPIQTGVCIDPIELGMVLNDKGYWMTLWPESGSRFIRSPKAKLGAI